MKKNLLFGAVTLLSSLVAVPAAMAYQDINIPKPIQTSQWESSSHHHRYEKIHYLKGKLENQEAERRRVEWAYHQARRAGDWPAARSEKNRLTYLDREIRHTRYELTRTYEERRWGHGSDSDWRRGDRDRYDRP